jgi:tetratricopeptide (TPR) repeat protein
MPSSCNAEGPNLPGVRRIFEQIPLSMSPDLAQAEALLKAQSWQAAHAAFQALVEGGPESQNPDAVHDFAICCFYLDDLPRALELLDRAVELQPDYGYRYASRAWMRAAAKRTHDAIADYKRAIELDPEDAVAHNNLGLLEEQLGYQQQAQERYRVADTLQGIFRDNGLESERPTPAAPPPPAAPATPSTTGGWMWWAIGTRAGRQAFFDFLKKGMKSNK